MLGDDIHKSLRLLRWNQTPPSHIKELRPVFFVLVRVLAPDANKLI